MPGGYVKETLEAQVPLVEGWERGKGFAEGGCASLQGKYVFVFFSQAPMNRKELTSDISKGFQHYNGVHGPMEVVGVAKAEKGSAKWTRHLGARILCACALTGHDSFLERIFQENGKNESQGM